MCPMPLNYTLKSGYKGKFDIIYTLHNAKMANENHSEPTGLKPVTSRSTN